MAIDAAAASAIDEFRTPRPVAGWRVVLTAFCMALVAWGLGFYSLSVYVQYLASSGRFSAALLSTATSFHFLVGAAALYAVEYAAMRFGRRRVVMAGVLLMAGCASALACWDISATRRSQAPGALPRRHECSSIG